MNRRMLEIERADYRTGVIASVIANVNRPKGHRAYKPEDFMPRTKKKAQSPEQMLAMVKNIQAMREGQNG